jgi:hypothetical protein
MAAMLIMAQRPVSPRWIQCLNRAERTAHDEQRSQDAARGAGAQSHRPDDRFGKGEANQEAAN